MANLPMKKHEPFYIPTSKSPEAWQEVDLYSYTMGFQDAMLNIANTAQSLPHKVPQQAMDIFFNARRDLDTLMKQLYEKGVL